MSKQATLLSNDDWDTRHASDALVSPDGRYRYWLTQWGAGMRICWVMLNPSTADASLNDPTLHRCIKFSKAWGFGSLVVVNLWALRSSKPKDLLAASDPCGPDNAEAVELAINGSAQVILAWGTFPAVMAARGYERLNVEALADEALVPIGCLGRTSGGHPKHPLARGKHRVPDDAPILPWHQSEAAS